MPRKAKPATLSLDLEKELLARLDSLIDVVADSPAAREFGVEVTRPLVARMALLRGLSAMESGRQTGRVAPAPVAVSSGPVKAEPLKAPGVSEAPAEAEAKDVVERDSAGHIKPPEGWSQWSDNEKVPAAHASVHEYYTAHGVPRWWGKAGDEVIAFYWSPDPTLQDVPVYGGVDANGKSILIQETPHGPGHMIPHGWMA
jgi:hypothetical protein